MSLSQEIANFQTHVRVRDKTALATLNQAYTAAYNQSLSELEYVMKLAAARDKPPTRTWLLQEARLSSTILQIEQRLAVLNGAAAGVISVERMDAAAEAINDAQKMIESAFPPSFTTVSLPAFEAVTASFNEGSPLRDLFAKIGPEVGQMLRTRLTTAILRGEGPAETARQILDVPRRRAMTIARTEILRAYREGALGTFRENTHVVKGWRWNANLGRRTCAMCVAMHGKEFPLDVPFGSHPNCRCAPSPVTKSWTELGIDAPEPKRPSLTGGDWFEKQDPATQLAILGPRKYELYKQGDLGLSQLVGYQNNKVWGPQRFERSLRMIQEGTFKHPALKALDRIDFEVPEPTRPTLVPVDHPTKLRMVNGSLERVVDFEGKRYIYPGNSPRVQQALDVTKLQHVGNAPPPELTGKEARERIVKLTEDAELQKQKYLEENRKLKAEVTEKYNALVKQHGDNIYDKPEYAEVEKIGARMMANSDASRAIAKKLSEDVEEILFLRDDTVVPYRPSISGNVKKPAQAKIQKVFNKMARMVDLGHGQGRYVDVNVIRPGGRAFQSSKSINITESESEAVILHELGHQHEEFSTGALVRALNFYDNRTKGESLITMREATGVKSYSSSEVTRKDKFMNAYMGKDYGRRATEIHSMGLEYFLSKPEEFARRDPDMFEFIYDSVRRSD